MVILQVVIQKIPENLQEYEILAVKGRQPEHICALFLCASALFDGDKDAGTAAMNESLARSAAHDALRCAVSARPAARKGLPAACVF